MVNVSFVHKKKNVWEQSKYRLIFTKKKYFFFIFQAKSPEDAEKGLLFMQEMVELSKGHHFNVATELQVRT